MGFFTFVRFMMVFFNLLIFMGGLSVLTMGIWVSVDGGSFLQILGPFSNQGMEVVNFGFFCIVIGGVLVLLGLLGSCAALKKSKCLLLTFFSIIIVIFFAEVAAGAVVLAYSSFGEEILRGWAIPALHNYYGSDPVVSKLWNSTMTELRCCGFSDYTDFVGSKFANQTGGSLPSICCMTNSTTCSPALAERIKVQGCFNQIMMILRENINIVGGVAAGIGLVEIAAMIVSMYLYCHLHNEDS